MKRVWRRSHDDRFLNVSDVLDLIWGEIKTLWLTHTNNIIITIIYNLWW